jgi:integrase
MNTPLTQEQAEQLLAALRGHPLEAIITLALVTGLRRDELLSLRWQEVDLERCELRVRQLKTKNGYRMIPFPQSASEVLREHRVRQRAARWEADTATPDLDLVFPDQAFEPLRPDQLLKGFYEFLAQAELPRMRFHDLRVAWWRTLLARLPTGQDGAST